MSFHCVFSKTNTCHIDVVCIYVCIKSSTFTLFQKECLLQFIFVSFRFVSFCFVLFCFLYFSHIYILPLLIPFQFLSSLYIILFSSFLLFSFLLFILLHNIFNFYLYFGKFVCIKHLLISHCSTLLFIFCFYIIKCIVFLLFISFLPFLFFTFIFFYIHLFIPILFLSSFLFTKSIQTFIVQRYGKMIFTVFL